MRSNNNNNSNNDDDDDDDDEDDDNNNTSNNKNNNNNNNHVLNESTVSSCFISRGNLSYSLGAVKEREQSAKTCMTTTPVSNILSNKFDFYLTSPFVIVY